MSLAPEASVTTILAHLFTSNGVLDVTVHLVATAWAETALLFFDGHHLAQQTGLGICVGKAWLISKMKDPSSFVG